MGKWWLTTQFSQTPTIIRIPVQITETFVVPAAKALKYLAISAPRIITAIAVDLILSLGIARNQALAIIQNSFRQVWSQYGWSFGEANPDYPWSPDVWDDWIILSSGADAPDSGPYGELLLQETGSYISPVRDCGADDLFLMELGWNEYDILGISSENARMYYRTSDSLFTQNSPWPGWTTYNGPSVINRYVQGRISHAA